MISKNVGKLHKKHKIYLSAILDLYDRRIVSYVISDSNNNALVFDTFNKAIESNPNAHPLCHSDRGYQYTSRTFHAKLEAAGMTQSMSRVAKCIDNGPMEGFWGILKRERYYGNKFNNRESLVAMINNYIEYYNTKTSDLLMKRTIPSFTGFNDIWQNIGETETSGVEFNLNYNPVRTKDLNVDISLNASRNWEKITALISGEDLPNNKWFIGEPLGVFYDYEKIGIWQLGEEEAAAKYNAKVGDIKVKDQNGDGSISAADDRIILGQVRPKWIASLGANVQYKNFDFSFNLNSRWGYLVKPAPYDDITMDGQRWLPAVDYWTPDNPTNSYPRADQASGYDTYRTSNGYQKGDHIKIQDITLGYSFENLLSKKVPIRKLRFYVQMRNIGYLYRAAEFDIIPEQPDINYTVPSSYNFGVNVTF